jgi:hypothetical protein
MSEGVEVLPYQKVSLGVADLIVEGSGAFEVGKEEMVIYPISYQSLHR